MPAKVRQEPQIPVDKLIEHFQHFVRFGRLLYFKFGVCRLLGAGNERHQY